VELGTAKELATAVLQYTHGVMDEALPDGTKLRRTGRCSTPATTGGFGKGGAAGRRRAGVPVEDIIGVALTSRPARCCRWTRRACRFA